MDKPVRLTTREADVLRLMARGHTYAQIGDALGVSLHTVASHVKNIYFKFEVHTARAAVWRAIELRLLDLADDVYSVQLEPQ